MAHSLAGKTIHVDTDELQFIGESNYAFLEVLDATSDTISYYGARSRRISLTFTLFEDENGSTGDSGLEAARKANADVNLTLDTGSLGNVRILSYRATRLQALNRSAPVYKCSAELVEV